MFRRITEPLRRWLRDKAVRVVADALSRHHAEQRDDLTRRFAGLRDELTAELHREVDRTVRAVHESEVRDRRDLFAASERDAVTSSAHFAAKVMGPVPHFPHPHATLEHALSLAPAGGLALEFGVYTGTTLKMIAAAREGRDVFGFDSFEGLPEDWRSGFAAGAFDVDAVPEVDGAELVVGWFSETLPSFLAEHPGPVSLLHVDSDLYSSARTVLDHVGPRLRPGSVIVFDEYFNYPGWQQGEYLAWSEYVAATGIRFQYAGYTIDNEQVVVQLTGT
ncbi:MAG: class I SAM-dependent methyltransferase [Pseudonocardiaceae bacterium]